MPEHVTLREELSDLDVIKMAESAAAISAGQIEAAVLAGLAAMSTPELRALLTSWSISPPAGRRAMRRAILDVIDFAALRPVMGAPWGLPRAGSLRALLGSEPPPPKVPESFASGYRMGERTSPLTAQIDEDARIALRASAWAKRQGGKLITNTSKTVRQGVAAIISRAFVTPKYGQAVSVYRPSPSERAIWALLEAPDAPNLGLTRTQAQRLMAAQSGWIAKADWSTPRAAARSRASIASKTAKLRTKMIKERAKVIAKHESLTAVHVGQSDALAVAEQEGRIDGDRFELEWVARGRKTPPCKTCEQCTAMDGQRRGFGRKEVYVAKRPVGKQTAPARFRQPLAHVGCCCVQRTVEKRRRM